jgi:hypothetical protein
MDEDIRQRFISNYLADVTFRKIWADLSTSKDEWKPGSRYFRDDCGLLFFCDADYQPRLCVPRAERKTLLEEVHEGPFESAHAGTKKIWKRLTPRYYWPRMKVDIEIFCLTCDICQKIKAQNFKRYGFLIPNPIPTCPYESISMDFIVDLPWSNEYNAILVVVCRLTKHASFIPTTTGLDSDGFTKLFVMHIASCFGLPYSIISDRDPHWTSEFWKAVSKALKTRMALSSSHHPQHDGQTEILNRHLETMLRAYTAGEKNSWANWIHLLEFAYNTNPHASTGVAPYFLLYGFQPIAPSDFLVRPADPGAPSYSTASGESADFLDALQMHRESARLVVARAQNDQAKQYNRG